MGAAETAKLVASLDLNTSKFDKGIGQANKSLGLLGHTVSTALGVGLANAASKGISLLSGAIGEGIQGALELERTTNATAAVIKSTGGVAGVTAEQVRDLAQAEEELTGVDDKTVQQGENLLLTFKSIGKDVFPEATAAAVNMAVALNKGDAATADIDGSATRLGKALEDPIKGITALRKAGVNFTDAQQEQIKALVKSGKLQEAQKLILAELAKEYGEAGKAAQQGFAGDVNRANDAIEESRIAIAQGLIPALGEVARTLTTTLNDPQVRAGLVNLGKGLGEALKGAVAFAKTVPWDKIASALGTAAGFAKDLLNAFLGLPTWVQTAVVTGWGLNKITGGLIGDLASGLIKGVLGINAGVVNVNGPVAGVGGAGAAGGAAGGLLSTVSTLAIPVTIAAIASKAVTDLTNAQFAEQGIKTNFAAPGSGGDNPVLAILPFGIGSAIQNIAQGVGLLQNPTRITAAATSEIGPDIEKLRGVIAQGPKTLEQASAILAAGAQRDAETSASINTIVAEQAKGSDIEELRGNIATGLQAVDAATMLGAHQTSMAASQAGFGVARQTAASGFGIESAIRANRPIINVDVQISATDITQVNVVEDRGGSRSGSRDGDGGGGPGQ